MAQNAPTLSLPGYQERDKTEKEKADFTLSPDNRTQMPIDLLDALFLEALSMRVTLLTPIKMLSMVPMQLVSLRSS